MTMRITYIPGPWWALVRHGHLVLLPEDTDPEHMDGLWQALEGKPGVESLLSAVLSARGLALTGMAPFGIISLESDVHTILRGPVSMAAEGRELSTHVNGLGVTTWMERRIPNQESLSLALDDVLRQNDGGEQPWLPIVEGIVPFGRLHVELPTDGPGNIEPLSSPNQDARPGDQADTALVASAAETATPGPAPTAEDPATECQVEPRTGNVPERETPAPAEVAAEPEATAEPEPDAESEISAATPEPADLPEANAAAAEDFVSAEEADETNTVLSEAARESSPEPAVDVPEESAEPGDDPADEATEEPASDDTIAGPHGEEEQPDPETLIDAVPWLAAARAQARPEATETQGPAESGADDLPTITSAPGRLETAPTPTPAPASDPEGAATPSWGDHDGNTVMRGDLPTKAIPATSQVSATEQPTTGPLVLGRLCAEGHANPPTSSSCGLCQGTLTDDPTDVARPSLGRMVISDGDIVELDRPAVVGRQPTISRSASESMPRVVQVKSPSGDISRSHLEVRLEGWHVMLVDLMATNGTLLVRQGMPPRRLGQGEKLMLLDGDIADLADGVSLRFEGLL
ncbi:FHA domain-containing protein [Arthrobacter sp. AOP36-C1-22]|uniref:FHA domain-containing protein n=1 Tax=Arthrobacter sp. AOP36-C1-22 TaxID=3457683 RepID=UPI004034EF6D